jgi:hypothetical protein
MEPTGAACAGRRPMLAKSKLESDDASSSSIVAVAVGVGDVDGGEGAMSV